MKKRRIPFFIISVLSFLLTVYGCHKNDAEDIILPDPGSIAVARSLNLSKSQEEILFSINDFGLRLFKGFESNNISRNLFMSPYSVSLSLAMLMECTEGKAREELLKSLGLEGGLGSEIGSFFQGITADLLTVDPSTLIKLANGLWLDSSFKSSVRSEYLTMLKERYWTDYGFYDLSSASSVKAINNWCSLKTQGKIKGILSDPVGGEMIDVNTLYFGAQWRKKFERIEVSYFHHLNGDQEKIRMMRDVEERRYSDDGVYQYLSLPFGNDAFCFEIILPDEESFVEDIVNLEYLTIEKLRRSSSNREVIIGLPKFKIDNDLDMRPTLEGLGIKSIFEDGKSFAPISSQSLICRGMGQNVQISVDENGTIAAAATYKLMSTSLGLPPVHFEVNRPFLFLISERSSGTILFIGQFV